MLVQLVRGPTNIAGNRLNLVLTDVPEIVHVVVGTSLGTSDHCFVSCVLRVEQSVPEYNVRSNVFLKYRTNWDCVSSAVRSFTWSTILKPADPFVVFGLLVRSLVGMFLPLFCEVENNGLIPAAGELMMLNRLLIVPGV